MGYSNQEDQRYASAKALGADASLPNLEARNVNTGYFSIVWTGTSSGDAVVKLQDGQDGTTWNDMTGKTLTLSSTGGNGCIRVDRSPLSGQVALVAPLIRAVISHNTETTGTVSIAYFLKGDR